MHGRIVFKFCVCENITARGALLRRLPVHSSFCFSHCESQTASEGMWCAVNMPANDVSLPIGINGNDLELCVVSRHSKRPKSLDLGVTFEIAVLEAQALFADVVFIFCFAGEGTVIGQNATLVVRFLE